MKDDEAKIMEDIKYGKCSGGELSWVCVEAIATQSLGRVAIKRFLCWILFRCWYIWRLTRINPQCYFYHGPSSFLILCQSNACKLINKQFLRGKGLLTYKYKKVWHVKSKLYISYPTRFSITVIQLIEGEIFVEKAREVLKDFIHTRESVERLLFPLKIKYGSRFASSKWSELFS